MKKILSSILVVAAVFAVSSCEKNLDIQQKGVVTEEDFYNTDADAEALLANMYASCFGGDGIAGTEGIYNPQLMLFNYSSDDILAAGGEAGDHAGFREYDEFRYDNANDALKQLYNGYANSILAANFIISNFTNENMHSAEPKHTSDVTEKCVAEARVFRAYMHMMMALTWYQPNIVTRLLAPDELPVQAESQKQVLDWVISECDAAIKSGKLYKKTTKDDKDATARMTVGFAEFVAGKAAMFNGDYQTAYSYLGALVKDEAYALVPSQDFWKLTHAAGDGNTEVLFAPNIIEDPNFTANAWGSGTPIQRGRWMIADVLCWRTDALASTPTVCENLPGAGGGWNGGAIQENFAQKFLNHDGKSPRRLATFLTEDEFLYEMDWSGSSVNDGTLEEKKADPNRGIKNTSGVYSHGKFFEWKRMVWHNIPRLVLAKGDDPKNYMSDDFGLGPNSNISNLCMARLGEALLLYAEACLELGKDSEGLDALKRIQLRAGIPDENVSGKLTKEAIMEEKQYELWFEGCRFHDLVRWSAKNWVNLDDVFNKSKIHDNIPTVTDKYFPVTDGKPNQPNHELAVTYTKAIFNPFESKYEYFPFPRDIKTGNPNLQDVRGWSENN